MALDSPDLTLHPPRSDRVRLGDYVILPRMLDKGGRPLPGRMANATTHGRWTNAFWNCLVMMQRR